MQKFEFTLQELAELTGATLIGDPTYKVTNVESLELATPLDVSFLANPRYIQAMRKSKAGVVFVTELPDLQSREGRNFFVTSNPSGAFQSVAEAFYGIDKEVSGFTGIHHTAVIHPSVVFGERCRVGPYAVIDKDVTIGHDCYISAGCYIGPSVELGHHCLLHPHVIVRERCSLGNRVILQPGVVIGSCGFGYLTDKEGRHSKLNQLGAVIIGDDVEIGANTTIDRSRFKNTRIGSGTKIDNLVQIGHGVSIGEDNLLVAQSGFAGSSKTGNKSTVAGQAAVAGHLEIGDHVVIAGRGGVTKSILKPGAYGGTPAMPMVEFNRMSVYLRNIEQYVNKIKALEERVNQLEGRLS